MGRLKDLLSKASGGEVSESDFNAEMERRAEQNRMARSSQKMRYWIFVPSRRALLGCKTSEDEAYSYGYSITDEHFEVYPLPTIDPAKASQLVKGKRIEQIRDLDAGMKRFKHREQDAR